MAEDLMPFGPHSRIRPSPNIAARIIDGEAVIVDPWTQEVHILNETGSFFWKLADGTRTLEELARAVAMEYEVEAGAALADLIEVAGVLADKKLVVQLDAENKGGKE